MRLLDNQIKIATPHWMNEWRLRQNRIISFSEEIDSLAGLSEAIAALALENDRPITILVHSPGGDVLEGLGIMDVISSARSHGIYITIHAIGVVASMAAILLQAASHRVMTPNSRMLLHEIREFSFMKDTTVSGAVDQARELEFLNDRLAKLVADRTNGAQTPETVKKMWVKDYWLWPEEALEMGLIDEVALVNFE